MNRRTLGLFLLTTFLIVLISGLVMYFFPFQKNMASMHTVFALLFSMWIVFHIINNKTPLFRYLKGQNFKGIKKYLSPLVAAFFVILAVGLYYNLPYLSGIYNFGNSLRNSQLGKTEQTFDYEIINLDKTKNHQNIRIEIEKGEAFKHPLFVVWVEDKHGKYVETLYVSRVISSSTFDFGKKVDGKWQADIVRRPESLPYWSHKRGIKAVDGLYMPLNNAQDLDAVTGATPTGNSLILTNSKAIDEQGYSILLELNQSFDWNDYYSKTKFPDDQIYSGSGQVGQPSLIYKTEINPNDDNNNGYYLMRLIGHGHHSGQDGKIYTDLSNITTAKNIAQRIIVHVRQP